MMSQNTVARPSSIPITSPRPERPNSCTSCKTTRLGAVPMATVFRTPQARSTGLEYSWPAHRRRITLRPPQQCSPDQQRQQQQGQEALCARRFKFYLSCLMH